MMRIHIHVVPGSKKQSVEKQGQDIYGHDVYKVKITQKPVDGEANKGAIRAVAEHFNVPVKNVTLVSGGRSREKLLEVII